MTKPIVAIRGEPGLSQTVHLAASTTGLEIVGVPLFEIRPLPWELPPNLAFEGLLIGSANVLRQGGALLAMLMHLPVYAVGVKTAKAATLAGFQVAYIGQGGLQAVLDHKAAYGKRFLRLSGSERVALKVRADQDIMEIITYENRALPAPPLLADMLSEGGTVLLHSAAAAEHFSYECKRTGINRSQIVLAALGPRIADQSGSGWANIHIATEPSDEALLALVKNICQ